MARDGARHTGLPLDDSNPYFRFDPNACIVCSRCVRACDEVQGTLALTIEGRGFDSRVAASQDEPSSIRNASPAVRASKRVRRRRCRKRASSPHRCRSAQ